MYWPVGAPRIYAASNSSTSKGRIYHSNDDVEPHNALQSTSYLNASSVASDNAQDDEELLSGHLTPTTPRTPAIQPVELDAQRRPSATSLDDLENGHNDSIREAGRQPILGLQMSRTGHLFAVITATSMTIWQTKPTAILAVVIRSPGSLETYGPNVSLLIRPDSAIFVVQTTLGYLITYSLATDPDTRAYRPHFPENSSVNTRRQSNFTGARNQSDRILWGPGEGGGVREVSVRFRMVIKVDAGIERALALDEELVVATTKPPAVQCIRWAPDSTGNQTSTELLSKMAWLPKKVTVLDMIYDRPMNLSAWITSDGKAFAVQRLAESRDAMKAEPQDTSNPPKKSSSTSKLFKGYCFHDPKSEMTHATKVAINARFSLIAVARADSSIDVYAAKDYAGNIPLSHTQKTSVSSATSGKITFLAYSPDGYCLFAGFEEGWASWSVFGKPQSTSFAASRGAAKNGDEGWLYGVSKGAWLPGGSEILLVGPNDDRLWILEMSRSSITGCYTASNISRTMLQTRDSIMVYRGYDLPDLTTISAESSLWHHAQIPTNYLTDQWPIRCSVISLDGRYVAVAGRRGLAHYSISSGRWKTFDDGHEENSFVVRGGMCWYQHILVAAVEAGDSYEVRLYPRDAPLGHSSVKHAIRLPAPIVLVSPSGEDSLLVYTYDNLLYHYIFTPVDGTIKLVQVGQIAFHGIVRSPARVRGLSWILPDKQMNEGDPAQDVATATVVFLVDGKLVLLQPSFNEERQLKYDMRVIAHNIEYFALTRDTPEDKGQSRATSGFPNTGASMNGFEPQGLKDSLWMFDGQEIKSWPDVQDVLRSAPSDLARELPSTVHFSTDFYPLSISLSKGILIGVEPELVQRRDINFAFFRFAIRTHLFIPPVLRFHLSRYDSTAALHLAHQYRHLQYFPHALEVLLHDVLDDEVDNPPRPDQALLPGVVSFLSSFPQYLDIIVQCTRKTEVRSWRTLFAYLPPPATLFEESLQQGSLKTAGGYLLVLHTFEELSSSSEQLVRLLGRARDEGDWELCKELARFLTALDESGAALREALELVDMRSPIGDVERVGSILKGTSLKPPRRSGRHSLPTGLGIYNGSEQSSSGTPSPGQLSNSSDGGLRQDPSRPDYFSFP
ncbi:hypothetical protein V491_05638 [Pseudogymnoascus sp. VKM F-3775]|nr:hypothetical protein V491_05638 [Pseudogymnoascus sp. VKM F-3775]